MEKVILKAMAQNPDARFQRVDEFRNVFEYSLRTPARPKPAPMPVQQPRQTYAISFSVPLPSPTKKDTNWAAIILSIMLNAVLCVGAWFLVGVLKGDDVIPSEPGIPIQPILPTDVPPRCNRCSRRDHAS